MSEILGDALNTKSKIITPLARASFVKIWKPDTDDNGRKRYGVVLVFNPATFTEHDKQLWIQMIKLYEMVKDDKWADKKGRHGPAAGLKFTFRKDDTYDLTKHPYYKDCVMVGANSYDRQPGVVDRNMNPITDQGALYSGCFVKAAVTMYPYTNAGGGVAVGLSSLIKVLDGEPLVATSNPQEEFKSINLSDYPVDNSELVEGGSGQASTANLLGSLGL
jgi:hypothetical protein